jgi:hypothetical protein
MANDEAYVHYYHAEAHALHGYLYVPLRAEIKPQAFVRVQSERPDPEYLSQHSKNFRLEDVISYAAAHTQVSASKSRKPGGGFITLATSVVEDLNVMHVVTADRVVAQIATEHPIKGGTPSATFLGTHFDNLRIAHQKVEPELNLNLCGQLGGKPLYISPGTAFMAAVPKQYARLKQAAAKEYARLKQELPDWIGKRYDEGLLDAKSLAKQGEAAKVTCSLVDHIKDPAPEGSFGHVIDVPHFGKVFLAELVVNHNSFDLTMIRMELGCVADGTVSVVAMNVNGKGGKGGGG